jgi:uncharacterized protein (DUF2252 family)
LRARALKMAESTHAYVRGNTERFYTWLDDSQISGSIPDGPPIWICGDCHLGNLGPIADAQGRIDVQIRDLDQTVVGNPAYDLIRLGLSLATAARGAALPGVTTARMIEQMVEGYDHALADRNVDDDAEPNVVRAVRRRALGRRWRHLAEERMVAAPPRIDLGKKFWAISDAEREALRELFDAERVRRMLLSLIGRDLDDRMRLADVAYWVKGCSSLGNLRYAALIAIGGTEKEPDEFALIDLKEAVASVAPSAKGAKMPEDHAERVVAGARALAPNLGDRMLAVELAGTPLVLRELMPQDLKIELEQFSKAQASRAARYLAYVVGVAHARQMGGAERRSWREELAGRRGGTIDAPSWLWRSVVAMIARHETGYLNHCRRYALSDAA